MLVATKLHMPPLRAEMVDRTRLVDGLAAGETSRLILITGQAGSGKTSLACQWLRKNGLNSVWYSIDKSDNEGDLFFRYLLTGFSESSEYLGDVLRPFLEGPKRLTVEETFPFVIECLDRLHEDVYVVLDDYHLITSVEIDNAILYLLRYMPPHLHLVILSRTEPSFPLGPMRVRNQLTEVTGSELSFTEDEGADFLCKTMALTLDREQMAEFFAYAEGWVGGLQLVGLALREIEKQGQLKEVLKTASRITADYLIGEIIDVQEEKVRSFLYASALLDRFNADVCRAITGIEETREILNHLLRANLFLVPLDTDRTWYRYHHLFSESIRPRIAGSRPTLAADVHRKAALWFAGHGYLEDAFQQAFATEDYEFVAAMLEDYLCLFFDVYANASVLRWLYKLPHGVFMKHPQLRLDECSFKVLSQRLTDVESVLSDIEERHRPRRAEEGQAGLEYPGYEGFKKIRFRNTFSYLKHALPFYRDPATADVEAMKQFAPEITEDERLFGLTLESTIASCELYQGDLASAGETLSRSWPDTSSSKSAFRKILWYRTAADLERWRGNLTLSQSIVEQALLFLDRANLNDTALKLYLYQPLAWVFYLRNDLGMALDYAVMNCRHAEQSSHVIESIGVYFLLALIHASRGDVDSGLAFLKQLRLVSRRCAPGYSKLADAYWAVASAMLGQEGHADKWLSAKNGALSEPYSLTYFVERLAVARLLSKQGRYQESSAVLQSLKEECAARSVAHGSLIVDVSRSAALYMSGHLKLARSLIVETIASAEREGYLSPFVECGSSLAPLLADVAKDQSVRREVPYFSTVLAACNMEDIARPSDRAGARPGSEAFTSRELEILKFIAAGYKKNEIAERLFISPHTVKAHSRHIFEKLQVRSKAEAISRARENGLLDR